MKSYGTSTSSGSALINALCSAQAYAHEIAAIELIETHISWVLLTGQYAYKIKKPVKFDFLDFSTLDKRRFYCQEEVRLNKRLAKDWYLAVVPITGSVAKPMLDGEGQAIEYAVKMAQFPSAQTLKTVAESGQLGVREIDQIVEEVATFHQAVARTDDQSPYGDPDDINHWFDKNFSQIKPLLDDKSLVPQLSAIEAWGQSAWLRLSPLLQQRKQQGFVRECHGDLHLGNMTAIDGQVVLFDCIEFNPSLSWIDVMSEVAFLVMDLWHWGYEEYAYRFLNRYFQYTGDYQGLALLRYYLVYRAMVRAMVEILRLAQNPEPELNTQIRSEFSHYVYLAERFTETVSPQLIITHGFSGSGKSTYASQLAEKIGALQLRSDLERKRLFGYLAQANTGNALNEGVYTPAAGQKTYDFLAEQATVVLKAGFSVIIDAAFLKKNQREQFQQLASDCSVKFTIIDFQANDQVLCERIKQRQNDPSEATIDVLHLQQQTAEPLSDEEKSHVITINTERDTVAAWLTKSP